LCPSGEACLALRPRLSLGNGRTPTHASPVRKLRRIKQGKTLAINPDV
jgi:hypothetical protein